MSEVQGGGNITLQLSEYIYDIWCTFLFEMFRNKVLIFVVLHTTTL